LPTSLTLSSKELESLKNYIFEKGLKRAKTTNEYELLRIEDGDIKIVVYKTGKVVHNDTPRSKRVIDSILELDTAYDYFLGSDEVGKGEWYGPLVVVCVALKPEEVDKLRKIGVRDSKLIKNSELIRLAEILREESFARTSVTLPPPTYNLRYEEFKKEGKSLNDFLAWAHARVIKDTIEKITFDRIKVVIDKFDVVKTYQRLYGLDSTKIEVIQKSKGGSEIPVAVASILAKYTFEEHIKRLNKKYKIDLKKVSPSEISQSILPQVAKLHFKNVMEIAKERR
jgi:ribonuclease HIII